MRRGAVPARNARIIIYVSAPEASAGRGGTNGTVLSCLELSILRGSQPSELKSQNQEVLKVFTHVRIAFVLY